MTVFRRNSTLIVMLASVVFGLAARTAFVDRSEFGPDDLARYEQRAYGADLPDSYENRPFWLVWSRGDGQAYITLGADPWAQREGKGLGVALYRYSRVGYSWAALLLVGGQSHLIPYGLFAVNVLALATLGWVASRRWRKWGTRSLILLIIPGALIAVSTDTAEALGLALAALAVTTSNVPSRVSAFVLGFVRPDFATALFLRGQPGLSLAAWCAAGAVGIRALGLLLGLEYSGLNDNLTMPFAGYVSVLSDQGMIDQAITVGLAAVSVLTMVRGITLESGWYRLAPIGTGLFVLMLSPSVLLGTQNSLRAAAALWLVWAVPPGFTHETDLERWPTHESHPSVR